ESNPVPGAEVVLVEPVDESVSNKRIIIYLNNGKLRSHLEEVVVTSDAEGKFIHYPTGSEVPAYFIAMHPYHGFAIARRRGNEPTQPLVLHPWGRLRGAIAHGRDFTQSANFLSCIPETEGWPEVCFSQFSRDEDVGNELRYEFRNIPPEQPTELRRLIDPVGNENGIAGTIVLHYQDLFLTPGEEQVVDFALLSEADRKQLKSQLGMFQNRPGRDK